ncbi:hypothetical protein PPYR_11644, partial [Photinus pyralis]
ISIEAVLKTSSPNRPQPILDIPRFIEKPELCVALTLVEYLKVSDSLRGNALDLFITIKTTS